MDAASPVCLGCGGHSGGEQPGRGGGPGGEQPGRGEGPGGEQFERERDPGGELSGRKAQSVREAEAVVCAGRGSGSGRAWIWGCDFLCDGGGNYAAGCGSFQKASSSDLHSRGRTAVPAGPCAALRLPVPGGLSGAGTVPGFHHAPGVQPGTVF